MFRYIADADRAVDVAELTDHFGFNHNAIRQHLAKLVDAELLVEEKERSGGRGRPRLLYLVHPTVDSRWRVKGPYERLAQWLAEMVRTGDAPIDVGRRVGRGERLDTVVTDGPVAGFATQMARHGFDPVVRQSGDAVEITLRNCPFESTALADPETVCSLHLGMAHGIAEGIEGLQVDELVPTDPRRPQCRLRCHMEPVD